jgi:subtilisin family serine protease
MAMNVRRQTWGTILTAILMLLMAFSAIVFAPVPVVSELEDETSGEDDSVTQDGTTEENNEVAEKTDSIIAADLEDLEWPEVVYPSGLGGNGPLGDVPPGTDSLLDDLVDRHGISGAWSQGVNGSGVNVALIDTGIDLGNPSLIGTCHRSNSGKSVCHKP